MSRVRLALAMMILAVPMLAMGPPPSPLDAPVRQEAPPRLVVLLVVDQLSADLFQRYEDLFTRGFRRLLDGGRVYPNATNDYAIAETSPGHATMAAGVYPSRHGVVANVWWEKDDNLAWKQVVNVLDPESPLIELPGYEGASPRVLLRSGLADWMYEYDDDTKVVSIAGKERAAILMASLHRGHVYWFDASVGRFVTSIYYRDKYPRWVRRFNEGRIPEYQSDSTWWSEIPREALARSRPDTTVYEADGTHTAFPHVFREGPVRDPPQTFHEWLATTPAVDALVLEMARAAIDAEDLGDDETPDFLAISLSQTDKIGHAFGPYSREQLDNLLRLDKELGEFFEYLDAEIGDEAYVVAFTADHGVLEIPEFIQDGDHPGVRLTREALGELQVKFDEVVRGYAGRGPNAIPNALVEVVSELPWVARAWTHEDLLSGELTDSMSVYVRRSLYPGRPGSLLSRFGVEILMKPNHLSWDVPRGTTHGVPYLYDRRVPFILMGPGIAAGVDTQRVSPMDIAPTLAGFAQVPYPDDLDGTSRKQ
ncbi:MAG: alkaline phosphatase family protein [Gemmatimonadetes bacterium]|nr:alkaline phosphatase family protein [Gemmatimonadota bacterium]